jgi:hypothetical protein
MAIKAALRGIYPRITGWYERNFSWRGAAALAWLLAKEIPSISGRQAFWSRNLPTIWSFVFAHSTILAVVAVGLIIWLDHRRMVKRQGQRYDLKTLRGRTLKFCDDLEKFKQELGAQPEVIWTPGNTAGEFAEANEPMAIREQKMHHGFHLRFGETAWKLWHEHGAERRETPDLELTLRARIDCDERLGPIIKRFRELAEMTDPIEATF